MISSLVLIDDEEDPLQCRECPLANAVAPEMPGISEKPMTLGPALPNGKLVGHLRSQLSFAPLKLTQCCSQSSSSTISFSPFQRKHSSVWLPNLLITHSDIF